MSRPRPDSNELNEYRQRILRETEIFLTLGLLHPERVIKIPKVPVGLGTFSPEQSEQFWTRILYVS